MSAKKARRRVGSLVLPFRVFGLVARFRASPPGIVLSELATRSEYRARRSIALIGSAIPLCRWPLPRLCGFPSTDFADHSSALSRALSSSFAFLQSVSRPDLAGRSQPASPSHGLWLPTALKDHGSTSRGPDQPATFRLQGLATLLTACSPRTPAGFVSHRRRSWDFPFGASRLLRRTQAVSGSGEPTYRFRRPLLTPLSQHAGPAGRGSWALTLSGVPHGRSWV